MENKKRYIDYNQRLDYVCAELKKKCRCGHTQIVPMSSKREYVLCKWCNARLYWDDNKQQEYNKKVAKDNFIFNLKKCIKDKEKESMLREEIMNKKNLKRKYFKNNADYFNFCKDVKIQIYIVDTTSSKSGNIIVYYGTKLGRPKKNTDCKPIRRRYKYYKNPRYNLYQ